MKRTVFTAFLAVLALVVLGRAQSGGKISLNGLRASVTVRKDNRGIPYIEAQNDADLYFAQGYITASDRLWQMDLMRRLARGETAEIFGAQTLEEDKRWRRFGFAAVAEASLKELSPALNDALRNYSAGVNAYITSLDDKTLPVEFRILQYKPREWRPSDTIVIGKILADALSTTWRNDLLRERLRTTLSPEKFSDVNNQITPYDVVLFGKDNLTSRPFVGETDGVSSRILVAAEADARLRERSLARVGLFAEELAASNSLVISGRRTADGKAILANDPHLQATAPGIWYLVHLSSPDTRVAGVSIPGGPGVVLGHNANIAWGATNVGPDVQDLYDETFNNAGEYKTPDGWQKPKVRKEVINVRTSVFKTAVAPTAIDVVETEHGPIILDEGGKRYALKWTALDPKNNEFEAFFQLNRAKDWTGFRNALKTYGGATQNFVYADVKGNIGWYAAGRIPTRRTGDGAFPYDGSSNAGDWTGYIPFDELPHLYDPPSGLIVTANQRIVGSDYKYSQINRDAAPPWRARRIWDRLSSKRSITMDDVRDAQYDDLNMPLMMMAKEIVKRGSASVETLDVLRGWDGRMTTDSRGALLTNEIRDCVAGKVADENPGVPFPVVRERILERALREGLTRWISSPDQIFRTCDASVRSALADLKRMGPDPANWTWGRVFVARFPHPLAAAPLIGMQFATPSVPLSGSGQTPNVGSAVSMRLITSPGNWDLTRQVIPLGESGDPASPHFKDQFEAWRAGTPAVFPFTKAAVEVAAREVWTLSPM